MRYRKLREILPIEPRDVWLLLVLLVFVFAVSALIYDKFRDFGEQRVQLAFQSNASDLSQAILKRVELYQYGVRGARGFAAPIGLDKLTRNDYVRYARTRDIDVEFPGARGFGIIYRISEADSAKLEQDMTREYGRERRIKYLTPHNGERYVIRYIEPLERNDAAVGLDIASESNRRNAAERAALTGLASLTGPITVVQAMGQQSSAFLLLLPIYRQDASLKHETERWDATQGWAYSVIVFQEIIQGISAKEKHLAFQISDITADAQAPHFYQTDEWSDEASAKFLAQELDVFGRKWQVKIQALPSLILETRPFDPVLMLALLLASGTSLFLLVYFFLVGKNRSSQEQKQQFALAGTLIEASPLGKFLVDANGKIVRVNRRLRELFGYTEDQLVGQPVEILVPGKLRDAHVNHRLSYRGQHMQMGASGEIMGQRADGSVVPVEVILNGVDFNGQRYVIGGINDITERLAVLEKLKFSEANWRDLANSLPQLVWTCSPDGKINFLSSQWKKLSIDYQGRDPSEVFYSLIHHQDLAGLKALLAKANDAEEKVITEARFKNNRGRYNWYDIQQVPVINELGKVTHWVGSATDIELRKAAQAEIMEINSHLEGLVEEKTRELSGAKQTLDNILNAVPSMIGYWNRDLVCSFANQSLSDFLAQLEEITQEHDAEINYEKLFGLSSPHVQAALSGRVTRFEKQVLHGSESRRYLDIHYIPNIEHEHVRGFFVLMQDVSEIRNAQLDAELMSKQKSAFLAVMSHEIRTPLNGILGFASLLSEKIQNPEFKSDIKILLKNAQTLTTILNDILDITKVESGQFKLEKIPFLLLDQLETCCVLHRIPAQEKGLEFKVTYSGFDERTGLMGDPTRLRQVVHNLLSNAIKFTSNGSVTLGVDLKWHSGSAVVEVSVSDTGVGIPAENQAGLFKPFYQGSSSTFRKFGGTGLGLSVIKSIVDAMDGQISFSSQEGIGSTFKLVMPFSPAIDAPVTETAAKNATQLPKSILIVDDMPLNLMVLNKVLDHDGHCVTRAQDGPEAVRLAGSEKFDLILLDISMPGMDGYEASRLIRSEGLNMMTPIVALSGHAFDEDIEMAISSGMSAHLSKPIDIAKLRKIISDLAK